MIGELFYQRNLDAIEKYYAPTFVIHRPWGSSDFEGWKKDCARILTSMPDYRFTVDDLLVAGEVEIVRGTTRGTFMGSFQGVSGAGKQVEMWSIEINRFENGKIVETWIAYDRLGVMQQLGTIPTSTT